MIREESSNLFAFFGLLLDAYKTKYMVNNFSIVPACVKKETNDYMASNDNVFGYITDNYERDDACFTTINDIWTTFASSMEFYDMTKREKETRGTKNAFVGAIQKSIHLRRYLKARGASFGAESIRVPFLSG